MRRTWQTIYRLPPRGWFDLALQFSLFFAAYSLYQLTRGLAYGREQQAFDNAAWVIDLERTVGAFFEARLQSELLPHHFVIDFANFMYLNSHFVITLGFLAWLYLFRNENFYFVRNMFMVAMVIALIGYATFPTAPPRLLPQYGFTDTIEAFTGVAQDSATSSTLINKYAAVPSMHIAFSLMVAVPALALTRLPLARAWWSIYPLLVFFAIIVTGNHFWFDAAAGAAVASVAAVAAHQLARVRPERWSWRGAQPDRAFADL